MIDLILTIKFDPYPILSILLATILILYGHFQKYVVIIVFICNSLFVL